MGKSQYKAHVTRAVKELIAFNAEGDYEAVIKSTEKVVIQAKKMLEFYPEPIQPEPVKAEPVKAEPVKKKPRRRITKQRKIPRNGRRIAHLQAASRRSTKMKRRVDRSSHTGSGKTRNPQRTKRHS